VYIFQPLGSVESEHVIIPRLVKLLSIEMEKARDVERLLA